MPEPSTPSPVPPQQPDATDHQAPAAAQRVTHEVAQPPSPPSPPDQPAAGAPGVLSLADVRRMWPDLLDRVKERRRFTWILLSQNAQVIGFDGSVLTVGLKNAGARESFVGGASDEVLRETVRDLVGADWRVEAVVDPSADPDASAPRVTRSAVPDEGAEARPQGASAAAPGPSSPTPLEGPPSAAPDWATGATTPSHAAEPARAPAREGARPESLAQARSNIAPTRHGDAPRATGVDLDADADRDDPDADDTGLDGRALLERELGAVVIDEISSN